mmetsp:Transcript_74286/g.166238  ORF Transcript_74286/g.166238 Transcript_74286/m.166238 type:complete len:93 (-) Transcript_74286:107-385(-)
MVALLLLKSPSCTPTGRLLHVKYSSGALYSKAQAATSAHGLQHGGALGCELGVVLRYGDTPFSNPPKCSWLAFTARFAPCSVLSQWLALDTA